VKTIIICQDRLGAHIKDLLKAQSVSAGLNDPKVKADVVFYEMLGGGAKRRRFRAILLYVCANRSFVKTGSG
jgi:hypothetical protein